MLLLIYRYPHSDVSPLLLLHDILYSLDVDNFTMSASCFLSANALSVASAVAATNITAIAATTTKYLVFILLLAASNLVFICIKQIRALPLTYTLDRLNPNIANTASEESSSLQDIFVCIILILIINWRGGMKIRMDEVWMETLSQSFVSRP